jgi:hypothetical protein
LIELTTFNEESEIITGNPAQILPTLKLAIGFELTETYFETESIQPLELTTINFTKYVPEVLYKCIGFDNDDVIPSPKLQLKEISVDIENEVLKNFVESPTHTFDEVKLATGFVFTIAL